MDSHVFVCSLHSLCCESHILEHLGVSVGVLQCLPLELDGGQSSIDLGQLLLIAFLPLQCL